jgi:chromosome partitioning protein
VTVTIAAISGKGGTGKTTTVINLGCALAERDRRVLVVDMDPQANLTSGLGFDPYHLELTVFDVLTGESADGSAVLSSDYEVDLLPASPDLSGVESALASGIGRELLLKEALGGLTVGGTKHDYVLIDTPPNFGFHTLNALAAADYVLVPVQMSGFAIKGLKEVLRTLAAARQQLNPGVRVLGVLPTFVNPRTNFSRDMLDALRGLPNLSVFGTEVKSTVKLAETSLEGVPILNYASKSDAASAYRALAAEVLDRIEGRDK